VFEVLNFPLFLNLAPSFFQALLKTTACLSGPVLNILKCRFLTVTLLLVLQKHNKIIIIIIML